MTKEQLLKREAEIMQELKEIRKQLSNLKQTKQSKQKKEKDHSVENFLKMSKAIKESRMKSL